MLVAEQLRLTGLAHHRGQEGLGDVVVDEPVAVLAEGAGVPHRVVDLEADEPAEEQVVVEPLHEQPLAADRVQQLQHQRAQQALGRDGGPADLAVHALEHRIELAQSTVRHRPDGAQGMVLRDALLEANVAPHLCRPPRIVVPSGR